MFRESRAHELRLCASVSAKSVVQLCLRFHYLGLHHRHYVCHVGAELLHRRFPDGRAIKICQRLQLFSGEMFYHRV